MAPFRSAVRARGSGTPFTRTMLAICEARGIPFLPDQNGVWEDGVFEMAVNVDEQRRRVSTAWAYLGPEIRRRPNLEIRTDATVSRILFAQGRADRALVMKGGTLEEIKARHIILSTGALATPAIFDAAGSALHPISPTAASRSCWTCRAWGRT